MSSADRLREAARVLRELRAFFFPNDVALALANWLDAEADFWTVEAEGADGEPVLRSALTVADLILGGDDS